MTSSTTSAMRVAEDAAEAPRRTLSDNRILIIDRDTIFRTLAFNALSLICDEVVPVRDSLEALQAMEEQEFDLVIVEIAGPKSEGLLLLARLLFKQDVHHGRVVGLLNCEDAEADYAASAAKEFGIERLLASPCDLQDFVDQVVDVLQARTTD